MPEDNGYVSVQETLRSWTEIYATIRSIKSSPHGWENFYFILEERNRTQPAVFSNLFSSRKNVITKETELNYFDPASQLPTRIRMKTESGQLYDRVFKIAAPSKASLENPKFIRLRTAGESHNFSCVITVNCERARSDMNPSFCWRIAVVSINRRKQEP